MPGPSGPHTPPPPPRPMSPARPRFTFVQAVWIAVAAVTVGAVAVTTLLATGHVDANSIAWLLFVLQSAPYVVLCPTNRALIADVRGKHLRTAS